MECAKTLARTFSSSLWVQRIEFSCLSLVLCVSEFIDVVWRYALLAAVYDMKVCSGNGQCKDHCTSFRELQKAEGTKSDIVLFKSLKCAFILPHTIWLSKPNQCQAMCKQLSIWAIAILCPVLFSIRNVVRKLWGLLFVLTKS